MSRPTLEIHGCRVWGYPLFKCFTCGATGRGDFFKVDVGGAVLNKEEAEATISPHYMPVGWASYGGNDYRCPEHAV